MNFTFYDDNAFLIQRIHPLGGKVGTALTIYLLDDRLLVDLGGQRASGLKCRFATLPTSGDEPGVHQEVPAILTNCRGRRACGAGWAAMGCSVPSWHNILGEVPQALAMVVEVSLNGQNFSSGGKYYDEQFFTLSNFTLVNELAVNMASFFPYAGPLSGGTLVTVSGSGFASLGDVHCRFGSLNSLANASIISKTQMICRSPPLSVGASEVAAPISKLLEVTLNGQQYHRCMPMEITTAGYRPYNDVFSRTRSLRRSAFTYFAVDDQAGLSVESITPHGGPTLGGTRVTLRGSGFDVFSATTPECQFDQHGVQAATIVSIDTIVCVSPPAALDPTAPNTTAANATTVNATATEATAADATGAVTSVFSVSWSKAFAVEVGINGDLAAFTTAGMATFAFHPLLRLYSIHPRGGSLDGGTPVTVTGSGFEDLNHGRGLQCLFGKYAQTTTAVAATLNEARSAVICHSPPLLDSSSTRADLHGSVVPIRVTNNANNPPYDSYGPELNFTYIDI